MNTYFFAVSGGLPLSGTLKYLWDEYSFFFSPADPEASGKMRNCASSLLLGYLALNIDLETGRVVYADGLLAHPSWRHGSVSAPTSVDGSVWIDASSFEFGVSQRLVNTWPTDSADWWPPVYDKSTGWLRIGGQVQETESRIRIADGTIVGIDGGVLTSLFLMVR